MQYKTIDVEGLSTFYRECGSKDKPVMLLLHGTATSSYMFRNLMPLLGQTFHVIAPDYIGCGNSAAPDHTKFNYTYEHLTDYLDALLEELRVEKFYMYVFDDGAPIGFNLARRHPYNILGIVSQNGNIYQEGLGPEWNERQQYWKKPTQELREKYKAIFSPDAIKSLYLTGERLTQSVRTATRWIFTTARKIMTLWNGSLTSWLTTRITSKIIRTTKTFYASTIQI